MEAYAAAKNGFSINQDTSDYALLNYDDARIKAMEPDMTGTVLWFLQNRKFLQVPLPRRAADFAHGWL